VNKIYLIDELLKKIPVDITNWPRYLHENLGEWLNWVQIDYDSIKTGGSQLPYNYCFKPSPKIKLPTHALWVKCPKCKNTLSKHADIHKSGTKKYFDI